MARLVLSLLGPPRIECDGALAEFETRKAVALLAYLAITGEDHSRDALAALFWPESSQARARGALRYTLTSLKKALGDDWLTIDRETIGLCHDSRIWLDVDLFRHGLGECRSHGHRDQDVCPTCLPALADSVALYHDHFMAGFTLRDSPAFDEWQFFEGERLRSELASALERLAHCYMAQEQWAQAIECARRLTALDPLHEPAQRLLMQLYAWAGQRAAALRQYDECARVVARELGAAPSEETTQLYTAIKERRLEGLPAEILPRAVLAIETEGQSLVTHRSERVEGSLAVEQRALATPDTGQVSAHSYPSDRPTASRTTKGYANNHTIEAAATDIRRPITRRSAAIGAVAVLLALIMVAASGPVERSPTHSGGILAPPTIFVPATVGSSAVRASSEMAVSAASTRAPATTPAAAMAIGRGSTPAGWRGQGGTLRIVIPRAPESLNPHQTGWAWDVDAARLVLEPLAAIGPDGSPVPVLAAEIPTIDNGGVAKDFMSVTWKLKPEIAWSDGSVFTAADVAFTYQYCADAQTACSDSYAFEGATKVEVLDPLTVKVTWQRPTPYPYRMFAGFNGLILQKQQFGACVGAAARTAPACQQANQAPIGTGPYKLHAFNPGGAAAVIYDINKRYRDPNKPFFGEVRIASVADYTAAASAVFEDSTADFAPYLVPVDVATLKRLIEIGKGEWLVVPTSLVEHLALNRANPDPALGDKRAEPDQPHPFLSDLRVRRALALAIDRRAIAEQVYRMGLPMRPSCEIVVTEPYIAPNAIDGARHTCDPDIARARELLDAAGWKVGPDGIRQKNGVRMRMVYQTGVPSSAPPVRQKVQELVKAAWQQLGIAVELKTVDYQAFFSDDPSTSATLYHFYADVEEFASGYDYPDPADYLCRWSSDQIARKDNGWHGQNVERFASAEYDLLCARLRVETDPAQRKEIILRMNDILVEDVVAIPLGTGGGNLAAAYAKRINRIKIGPWDSAMWNIADWVAAP